MSAEWPLRRWLERNQSVVRAVEYLVTAGVLLIPSSLTHYELATEGCYALSQLIAFFNRAILNRTLERCSRIEDALLVITRVVSHIEVLVEKASGTLAGRRGKAQAVFFVESFKSLCRLGILADRRKPTMLIHWGRHDGSEDARLDVAHYEQWYKAAAHCFRTNSGSPAQADAAFTSSSASAFVPVMPSSSAAAAAAAAGEFVGKRSGIVLPALPELAGLPRAQPCSSPSRVAPMPTSSFSSPSSSSARGSGQAASSPFGPSTLLADMMHLTGGRAGTATTPRRPPTAPAVDDDDDSGGSNSRPQSPSEDSVPEEGQHERRGGSGLEGERGNGARPALPLGITPEQCIVLGELLYVLRPAVYAWALHYIASRHGSTPDSSDPAATAPPPPPSERAAGGGGGGGGRFFDSGSAFSDDDDSDAASHGTSTASASASASAGVDANSSSSSTSSSSLSPAVAMEQAIAVALSLVVEVASIQLTAMGLRMTRERAQASFVQAGVGAAPPPTGARKHKFDAELNRRRTALLFYLIRSPIFDRTTLPLLQTASRLLQHVPFISSLTKYAQSLLSYLNRTHFYSSASS
jgi:hypothetical protein